MVRHQFRLSRNISWGEMGNFQRLGFDPTKGLKILEEEIIFGKLSWELDGIVATSLRYPRDCLVVRVSIARCSGGEVNKP